MDVSLSDLERNLLLMGLWSSFGTLGGQAAAAEHLGEGELGLVMDVTGVVRSLVVKLGGDPVAEGYGAGQ